MIDLLHNFGRDVGVVVSGLALLFSGTSTFHQQPTIQSASAALAVVQSQPETAAIVVAAPPSISKFKALVGNDAGASASIVLPSTAVISSSTVAGVSKSYVDDLIQDLRNSIPLDVFKNSSYLYPKNPGLSQATVNAAISQRIDQLANITISNATVHGVSGLTAADIPTGITAINYLPLTGGALSGVMNVSGLSTLTGLFSIASSTIGNGTASGGLTVFGSATTTGSAYFAGNIGVGTTSPGALVSVQGNGLFSGNVSLTSLNSSGHIDVSSTGGYYMDGLPLLTASSTSQNLLLGLGNGGTGGLGQYMDATSVRNVAIGYGALFGSTQAVRNVAVGVDAGSGAISANESVFVGNEAGLNCKYCSYATAIGYDAFNLQTGSSSTAHTDDDLTVAIGSWAMGNTTYERYGTAIGVTALQYSATSTYDVAVGYQAMNNFNTNSTSLGLNTAIGPKSMRNAGSGTANTAVGWLSQQIVTGNYNSCLGSDCFEELTSGSYNTALGYFAGSFVDGSNPSSAPMVTGTSTVFIGDFSGLTTSFLNGPTAIQYSAAIGSHALVGASNSIVLGGAGTYYANVGIGTTSPYARLSVMGNSTDAVIPTTLFAVGYGTGLATTTALSVSNTGVVSIGRGGSIDMSQYSTYKQNGASVLYASSTKASIFGGETGGINTSTGSENAAFGHAALDRLTTGAGNTALGMRAGFVLTTGSSNVAIGNRALAAATSSTGSVAVGAGALFTISNAAGDTTGINNTALGYSALNLSTSGFDNTAVGYQSMGLAVTTGSRNTALGSGSLYTVTSGIRNTAIGYGAINGVNSGSNNVAIGYATGGITTGSGNILIGGNGISIPLTGGSNQLNIGNFLYGTGLDGTGTTLSNGLIGIGTTTPSSSFSVQGNSYNSGTAFFGGAITATSTLSVTGLTTLGNASSTIFSISSAGSASAPSIQIGEAGTGLYLTSSHKLNVALNGTRYGFSDTSGNFVFGAGSLPAGGAFTSATGNFLWGSRAGGQMTSSSNNVIMGLDAGLYLTTDQGVNPVGANVYVGYTAGKNSRGGGNVAIGAAAGGGNALAQTDNYSMTAIGENALSSVSASQKDTAVGSYALTNYKRGGQMTAIGRGAGNFIQEGSYTFLGSHAAGFFNVASQENIFIGDSAGAPSQWTGNPPRVTASQSGTVLTVTSFTGGDAPLAVGMVGVSSAAAALPANITITSFGTGTGGVGTYNVTPSQTVASQTMQFGAANSSNIVIGQASGSLGYADSNNIIVGNNLTLGSANNQLDIGNLIYGTSVDGTGQTVSTGNIGIGTSTPYAKLSVWGTSTASTTIFSAVNSASTTVFAVYGNGNATYSGSIFQSSDRRLKENIGSLDAASSLAAVNALDPVSYTRIDQPTEGQNLGFIAQAVQQIFPALVSTTSPTKLTPDGTLTVNYLGLIAPIVKAVQAVSSKVSETAHLVIDRLSAHRVETQQLCVSKSDGTLVCITGEQLASMLNAGSGSSSSGTPSPDTTPPVITITGDNPAHLHVGDAYIDPGATVTDNVDQNLGEHAFVGSTPLDQAFIDTSTTTTYHIDYVATDSAGNTATSTRTVIVAE